MKLSRDIETDLYCVYLYTPVQKVMGFFCGGNVFLFHEMTNTYEWWSAIIDTNHIFVANYYVFPVYIVFFDQIRYLNIRHERTLTSSPLMLKCSERCRETQERETAHIGWCLVIQPQKFPRYFEIGSWQNWFTSLFPYFCSDGLYDVPPSHLDTLLLSLSGYSFVFVCKFLPQLNCHFDIAFFEHYLLQTTTAAKQANEIWNFTYPPWNTS